ncbi:MAG: hypothetical protein HRT68_02180 [Flavobacteriaceae bacterium]|nr:hypothetical protein [Flavobacteriaceae bacterium]
MQKKNFLGLFIAFLALINLSASYAQNGSNPEYYEWFDAIIGVENTGLYDGIEYKEKYRTINEKHKFFLSPNFLKGDVIYDGQIYANIDMKYDLHEDLLLVKLKNKDGGDVILELMKDKVNSFSIAGNNFVQLKSEEQGITGFYEVLSRGKGFTFFKKNKKHRKEKLDKKVVYSEFNNDDEYILLYNDIYSSIKSKRTLTKIFPEYKKDINVFHDNNENLLRSNPDAYMSELMRLIDKLMS